MINLEIFAFLFLKQPDTYLNKDRTTCPSPGHFYGGPTWKNRGFY